VTGELHVDGAADMDLAEAEQTLVVSVAPQAPAAARAHTLSSVKSSKLKNDPQWPLPQQASPPVRDTLNAWYAGPVVVEELSCQLKHCAACLLFAPE
jgi:hypothetical protein